MHARQQILHAVRDVLDAAVSPPWRSVYVSAIVPGAASFPCLLVRQEGETAGAVPQQGFMEGTRMWRTLSVAVLYAIKARSNPEDTTAALNEGAAAVEAVLTLDALVAQLAAVKNFTLQSTDIDEEPDASGYVTIATTWQIEYMTADGAPSALVA